MWWNCYSKTYAKSITNKEVEMVAFCDIILEKAEKAKEEFGTKDAKVYKDYKELLKR
jgi:predicted dehydrogenase